MPSTNQEFNISSLHSIQPWFMLGANHFSTLMTQDTPLTSHFYSFDYQASDKTDTAIPDGCVDLLFDCNSNDPNAYVCGTPLEASKTKFKHGHNYFGVRFRPGVIPGLFKLCPQDLVANRLDLHDLINNADSVLERICQAHTFMDRAQIVSDLIEQIKCRPTSYLTMDIITKIIEAKGNIQIQDLADDSGYSARTLQRTFRDDIGLTPKAFSRAIRCQTAIYQINHHKDLHLSKLASELGFSDQAHFQREFKKLVSVTPMDYQTQTTTNPQGLILPDHF